MCIVGNFSFGVNLYVIIIGGRFFCLGLFILNGKFVFSSNILFVCLVNIRLMNEFF